MFANYKVFQVVLAALPPLLSSGVWAADGGLDVKEAVWTSHVEGQQYTDRLQGVVSRRDLTLWTRLEGGDDVLDRLEKEGKLPIRHVWLHWTAAMEDGEKPVMKDAIALGVGAAPLVKELRSEALQKGGRFDWRTWSSKKNLAAGEWVVEIRYRDGKPVQCGEKACRYSMTVSP